MSLENLGFSNENKSKVPQAEALRSSGRAYMYMNAFMPYRHSAEHKSHIKNSCASDISYGGWLSILCPSAVILDGIISLRCTRFLSPSLISRPLQDTVRAKSRHLE